MKPKTFIKLIEEHGWYFVRQRGSHKIFKHLEKENHLSVPVHGNKDMAEGTWKRLLRDAGIQF